MRRADRLEEHRDNADRAELRELDMSTTNAAQQEYWNSVAGPRWVGLAGFVEKRVQKVNDLLLERSAVAPGEKVIEVGFGQRHRGGASAAADLDHLLSRRNRRSL